MCNKIRPNHEARCYETLIQSKLSNCSNVSENAKFHIVHIVSVIKSIQPLFEIWRKIRFRNIDASWIINVFWWKTIISCDQCNHDAFVKQNNLQSKFNQKYEQKWKFIKQEDSQVISIAENRRNDFSVANSYGKN